MGDRTVKDIKTAMDNADNDLIILNRVQKRIHDFFKEDKLFMMNWELLGKILTDRHLNQGDVFHADVLISASKATINDEKNGLTKGTNQMNFTRVRLFQMAHGLEQLFNECITDFNKLSKKERQDGKYIAKAIADIKKEYQAIMKEDPHSVEHLLEELNNDLTLQRKIEVQTMDTKGYFEHLFKTAETCRKNLSMPDSDIEKGSKRFYTAVQDALNLIAQFLQAHQKIDEVLTKMAEETQMEINDLNKESAELGKARK